MPVTQETVTIRQELAEANPDQYRAGLATSLANLPDVLLDLNRTAEADRARHEAAALR